jgi:hypothetical protein
VYPASFHFAVFSSMPPTTVAAVAFSMSRTPNMLRTKCSVASWSSQGKPTKPLPFLP